MVQTEPSHPSGNSSLVHTLAFETFLLFGISFFAIKNCVILQADEAFHIGAAASRESYLKMEKIIEVAIQSGAQVKKDCPHLHLNLICEAVLDKRRC